MKWEGASGEQGVLDTASPDRTVREDIGCRDGKSLFGKTLKDHWVTIFIKLEALGQTFLQFIFIRPCKH